MASRELLEELGGVAQSLVSLPSTKNDIFMVMCNACKVRCESVKTWQQHFSSKKHVSHTRSANLDIRGFPLSSNSGGGSDKVGTPTTESVPRPRSQVVAAPGSSGEGIDIAKTLSAQIAGRPASSQQQQMAPSAPYAQKSFAKAVGAAASPSMPIRNAAPSSHDAAAAGKGLPPYITPAAATAAVAASGSQQRSAGGGVPTATAPSSASAPTIVISAGAVNANRAKMDGVVVLDAAAIPQPLLESAVDRQLTRTAKWLGDPSMVRVETIPPNPSSSIPPNPSSSSSPSGGGGETTRTMYKGTFLMHVNCYAKLTGATADTHSTPPQQQNGSSAATNAAIKAAWAALTKEIKLSEAKGGQFVKIETKEKVTLAQLRTLETFVLYLNHLAAYDDRLTSQQVQSQAIMTPIDNGSFWDAAPRVP